MKWDVESSGSGLNDLHKALVGIEFDLYVKISLFFQVAAWCFCNIE